MEKQEQDVTGASIIFMIIFSIVVSVVLFSAGFFLGFTMDKLF